MTSADEGRAVQMASAVGFEARRRGLRREARSPGPICSVSRLQHKPSESIQQSWLSAGAELPRFLILARQTQVQHLVDAGEQAQPHPQQPFVCVYVEGHA